jgi:NifB/MoaA-like Fe-S oxidoreductase
MKRIVEQRLSPQYVSVHATDLKTRAYLLGVDESRADISEKLQTLLDNDIELHAQVVLCPEINDGAILEKTLRDLAAHYPKVVSTAVVPVALTRYSTDERLTRVTPEFCRRTIKQVEKLQKEFRRTLGVTFAFLGDEIYIKAGAEIPSRRHYGNYPQIEDGVGMVRSFVNAFEKLMQGSNTPSAAHAAAGPLANVRTHLAAMTPSSSVSKNMPPAYAGGSDMFGTIFTGEMFAPVLAEQIGRYNAMTGSRLSVVAVQNTYFGGDVSVAGLLSGKDFLAVRDQVVGNFVIIPRVTIKSDEPIFIDGMSYDELRAAFDVPVYDLDTDSLLAMLSR